MGGVKNVLARPVVQASHRRVAPQGPDGHSTERRVESHYCSARRGDGGVLSTQRHSGVFRHPHGGVSPRRRQYWLAENLGLPAGSIVLASRQSLLAHPACAAEKDANADRTTGTVPAFLEWCDARLLALRQPKHLLAS